MTTATLPATGERYQCDQCGMEIEVTTACSCEQCEPQFICCGEPLKSLDQSLLAESKEAFVARMQAEMDRTKEAITRLKEKAGQASYATREELTRDADALSQQYDKLRDSIGEVKESSGKAWKDVAKGCTESWQQFRSACEQAMSRYK